MSFARWVILDTGILASAAIRPASIPALALEKSLLDFDVCVSQATLAELERVLGRSRFDRYAPKAQREAFLQGFREQATMVDVSVIVTDCPDPKDNMFLALAETAIAELIISSDPHLTNMHPWRGIPILPPAAFLVGIK